MTDKITFFSEKRSINSKGRILSIENPLIMGILNITPDSFFDGGQHLTLKNQLHTTEEMLTQGADIIDIGGVSTRPGAKEISQEEEINRILPVIKQLTTNFPQVILSIDTFNSETARIAIEEGAAIINDISAGQFDNHMFDIIAKYNVPYIMMHTPAKPINMQNSPYYEDIMITLKSYFSERIFKLRQMGVNDIIIDPGFGFGKTLEHNFTILKKLKELKIFELPILAGVSRKSMINKVLKTNPEEALNGTTVINTMALMNGANILRAHDVKEVSEVVKLYKTYNQ